MPLFHIIKRKPVDSPYWRTQVYPASQVPTASPEFDQELLCILKASSADNAAYKWANDAVAAWALQDSQSRNPDDWPGHRLGASWNVVDTTAPLYVRVVDHDINYMLLDSSANVIHALSGTHAPCFGSYSMSGRPDFYSGRGPNRGDCGPKHLTRLYEGLVSYFGEQVGESFKALVKAQEDMSATAFLIAFHQWWANGKVAPTSPQRNPVMDFPSDENEAQRFAGALGTLGSVLFDRRSQGMKNFASEQIKAEFFNEPAFVLECEF